MYNIYYIYIKIEFIMKVFKIGQDTIAANMIIKSVPILCDMITAVIIYIIARKKLNSIPA